MKDEIEQYYNSIASTYDEKAKRARSRKENRLSELKEGSDAAEKALELYEEGYRFEIKQIEEGILDNDSLFFPVVFKVKRPGHEEQKFSVDNVLWYLSTGNFRAGDVTSVLDEEFPRKIIEAEGRKMISIEGVPDWLESLNRSIYEEVGFSGQNQTYLYLHILSKFRDEEF